MMFATNIVVTRQGTKLRIVFENSNRLADVTVTDRMAGRLLKDLATKLGVTEENT